MYDSGCYVYVYTRPYNTEEELGSTGYCDGLMGERRSTSLTRNTEGHHTHAIYVLLYNVYTYIYLFIHIRRRIKIIIFIIIILAPVPILREGSPGSNPLREPRTEHQRHEHARPHFLRFPSIIENSFQIPKGLLQFYNDVYDFYLVFCTQFFYQKTSSGLLRSVSGGQCCLVSALQMSFFDIPIGFFFFFSAAEKPIVIFRQTRVLLFHWNSENNCSRDRRFSHEMQLYSIITGNIYRKKNLLRFWAFYRRVYFFKVGKFRILRSVIILLTFTRINFILNIVKSNLLNLQSQYYFITV